MWNGRSESATTFHTRPNSKQVLRISEVILKSFKVFSSSAFHSKNLDFGGKYEAWISDDYFKSFLLRQ